MLITCHLLQAGKSGPRGTRMGDLILPLTSTWETGPCTNPGQHNRAGLVTVVPGTHMGDLPYGGVGEGEMITRLP